MKRTQLRWLAMSAMIGMSIQSQALTVYFSNLTGGQWGSNGNWSTGIRPTAVDDVLINFSPFLLNPSASVTLEFGTPITVRTLRVRSPFVMNGSTLSLALDGFINTFEGPMSMVNSQISGSGSINFSGPLTLTGGNQFQGTGTITTSHSANNFNITSGITMRKNWVNSGSTTVTGNGVFFFTSGSVTNSGTINIGTTDTAQWIGSRITNIGNINHFGNGSTAIGTLFSLDQTPFFNNQGNVTVSNGELGIFAGGTHTGNFVGGAEGRLVFAGGVHTFLSGSTLTGNWSATADATMSFSSNASIGGSMVSSTSITVSASNNAGITSWTNAGGTSSLYDNGSLTTLNVTGGTLNLTRPGTSTLTSFFMTGGSVLATSSLNVSSNFNISGGTLSANSLNLANGGTWTLQNNANILANTTLTGTLTVSTVTNSVGLGNLGLSSFIVNTTGAVRSIATTTAYIDNGNWINNGLVEVAGTGLLYFGFNTDGELDSFNNNGTVRANIGSFTSAGQGVHNGYFEAIGSALISLVGNNTFNSGAFFNGNLNLGSGGQSTFLNGSKFRGVAQIGNGVINLHEGTDVGTSDFFANNSGVLNLIGNTSSVMGGSLELFGGTQNVTGQFNLNILQSHTGTMSIANGAEFRLYGTGASTGTISSTGTGFFNLTGTHNQNAGSIGGNIEVRGGSLNIWANAINPLANMILRTPTGSRGGTSDLNVWAASRLPLNLTVEAGGVANINNGGTNLSDGFLSNSGQVIISNGSDVSFNGAGTGITNLSSGLIDVGSTNSTNPSQLLTTGIGNGGTLRINAGGGLVSSGQLSNSGFMSIGNGGTLNASGVGNSGTLLFGSLSSVSITGQVTQNAGLMSIGNGGTLNVSGGIQLNGGVLQGDGTIVGSVIANGGTLRPGNSPGQLKIRGGNLTMLGGSQLDIEIASRTLFDNILVERPAGVGGNVRLNGMRINVKPLAGYIGRHGDTFNIISWQGSMLDIGTPTISLSSVSPSWRLILDSVNKRLQLQYLRPVQGGTATPVPEPATMLAMGAGLAALIRRKRKR